MIDRLGELDRPYGQLTRSERRDVLSEELTSRRPLTTLPAPLDAAGSKTFSVFEEIRAAQHTYGPEVIQTYITSMTKGVRRHPGRCRAGQGGRSGGRARHRG